MSALRTLGLILCGFLLVSFLGSAIGIYAFSQAIEPEAIKPLIKEQLKEQLAEKEQSAEEQGQMYAAAMLMCANSTTGSITIPEDIETIGGMQFDCKEIEEAGPSGLTALIIDQMIDEAISKEPDCEMPACLESIGSDPSKLTVLFSEKSRIYFKQLATIFAVLAGLCAVGIILLSKPKTKSIERIGWALFVVGLPYAFFCVAERTVLASLTGPTRIALDYVLPIVKPLYLTVLLLGIGMVAASILLKKVLEHKRKSEKK